MSEQKFAILVPTNIDFWPNTNKCTECGANAVEDDVCKACGNSCKSFIKTLSIESHADLIHQLNTAHQKLGKAQERISHLEEILSTIEPKNVPNTQINKSLYKEWVLILHELCNVVLENTSSGNGVYLHPGMFVTVLTQAVIYNIISPEIRQELLDEFCKQVKKADLFII